MDRFDRLADYHRRTSKHDQTIFGKSIAALAAAKLEGVDACEYVNAKLRDRGDRVDVVEFVAMATKSAIPGLETGSSYTPSFSSIAMGTFAESVLGRVPGARRLPFVQQVAAGSIVGVGASWRKNGAGVRVAATSFAGVAMHRRSVAGICVASKEFIELAMFDNAAAATLSQLLRDGVRRELDLVFCGSNAAVTGQQPAGLGYNARQVASTGTTVAQLSADIRSMIDAMIGGGSGVSIRTAFWLLSAEAYSLLSALKVIDTNGTTLAGRPVVSDAPSGTFLLISADHLNFALDDQIAIGVSTSGTIEMDSAPSGDTITPAAMSHSTIGLFQTDTVALRCAVETDFALGGPTDSSGNFAAVALTSATFA